MISFYIASDYLPYKETMIQLWRRALKTIYRFGKIGESSRVLYNGEYEKIKYAELLIRCDYGNKDIELYPNFHYIKKDIAEQYYKQLISGKDTGHDYNEGIILNKYQDFLILELLKHKNSRRAVIEFGKTSDIVSVLENKEISCPRFIQFQIRDNKLHMHIAFRSKDLVDFADFYAFRKYQYKQIAKRLDIEMGSSSFYFTNAHIRLQDDKKYLEKWIKEGLI